MLPVENIYILLSLDLPIMRSNCDIHEITHGNNTLRICTDIRERLESHEWFTACAVGTTRQWDETERKEICFQSSIKAA